MPPQPEPSEPQRPEVEATVREVAALMEQGQYAGALAHLRRAVERWPEERLRALLAEIEGLLAHLESRDAFVDAYEADYTAKKESRHWGKWLERWVRTATGRRTRRMVAKTVSLPRFLAMERRILEAGARDLVDVGCHDGAFAISLGSRHPELRILGVDIAPVAIREARRLNRYPNVAFARLFAEDLPVRFPAPAFDLAIVSHTLEHVAEVDGVVRAVERVVRPGGLVFIAVPAGEDAGPGRLIVRGDEGYRTQGFVHTLRRFDRDALRRLFADRAACSIQRVTTDGEPCAEDRGPGEYFVTFRVPPAPDPVREAREGGAP